MIISYKHKFIFVKTFKTAGSSLEYFLASIAGEDAIVTPIEPPEAEHNPRNWQGRFNPIPTLIENHGRHLSSLLAEWQTKKKFYNHMPARLIRPRVSKQIWNSYLKFCVERNPWDKTLSHYAMMKHYDSKLTLDTYLRGQKFALNLPLYADRSGQKIIVDKIIRYEQLSSEFSRVMNQLGIPFQSQQLVKAKSGFRKDRTPYQEVYTKRQQEKVAEIFQSEIALHRYQF